MRDDREATAVVIINETLAERYYPDRDPIGQRINFNSRQNPVWRRIVGVGEDVKNFGVQLGGRSATYVPFHQLPVGSMTMVMRSRASGEPERIMESAREAMEAIDPNLAATRLQTMEAIVQASLGPEWFVTLLISLFAGAAFLLAVVGLYGVLTYGVNQRVREKGVRMALGASSGDIRRLVLRKSFALVGVGLAAGATASLALTRLMEGLLFGVSPTDPLTFAGMTVLFISVAAVASAVPSERAVRVQPIQALREE